jgi:hypothetical protein
MTETKPATKRQLADDARQAAMEGRWEDAITINTDLAKRSPKDAAVFNRLGKAQLELGNHGQAVEAYTASLKVDPANMIARQNLQRLEQLRQHGGASHRSRQLTNRTNVFIQEVGKTWVDELVNPASLEVLAEVASGEALKLNVKKGRLLVLRNDDVALGEIEPRTAQRVIELMAGGNQYECFALGGSASGLRVILQESFHAPSQAGRVSFPRQISQAGRYLRERDLIRQRDEADFYFSDDDEDESDTESTDSTSEGGDDFEAPDTDASEFVEERANDDGEPEV